MVCKGRGMVYQEMSYHTAMTKWCGRCNKPTVWREKRREGFVYDKDKGCEAGFMSVRR